ncbi:Ada metal-binding domain-containing protein [Rhizobium rhizophilum]|uniref:Ada metal-binding domain-containing protein n=1 Tax=Rhizobium rhizophilum TaxID=1850373 RepID=A0ABY2QUU2_9HYPH|nr:Ada metal-binding domain-containing protein [Rhizobium rhizophilum]THV14350.1 Ada metal-binding domain-containing protein [Rhizobium rhizophilum]
MRIDSPTTTQTGPTPAQWQAIRTRDSSMDGRFFYGVISTGIVCRPSCAARPARPESLVCYETVEQASAAGFRPCLRCRPDRPETW